jgi:hypothetical protein
MEDANGRTRNHSCEKRFMVIIRHLLQPIDQLTTKKTVQTLPDIPHAEKN